MPHTIEQRPPLQTRTAAVPHPSGPGRGNGYTQLFCQMVMAIRQMGESHNPIFNLLRIAHVYPSLQTEWRWFHLYNQLGHYCQCRQTGNVRATVLRDHDQIFLSLYRVAFPKATAAEINAFLYRCNYGSLIFRFYSSSQISECKKRIGFTRKRGSTTAYQALLPQNVWKRWCYRHLPYPFGIANIFKDI